tara:strand:+ start:970 stop:1914 length:945 start_codon:yes stop_codon:yes gene_type:complete
MNNNNFYVYTFYRFLNITNKKKIKLLLENYFRTKLLRGTFLIANEGINVSISGTKNDLTDTIKFVKRILRIRKLNIKINKNKFLPFNRIKVRLKKEIVSLGRGKIDVNKIKGKFIHPSKWNSLIEKENIKLIDTRNIYETDIGQFKGAMNPQTKSFREFPKKLEKMKIKKNEKLALYCTGGIRCEKASAYLKLNGFKNVVQLDGGILNYLNYINETKANSLWNGDCFVFDNRVTVDKKLKKGKYIQCNGCRHPITEKDTKLASYVKGVSCKYCYKKRTQIQKNRSIARQNQINLAEKRGLDHSFKKIRIQDINS